MNWITIIWKPNPSTWCRDRLVAGLLSPKAVSHIFLLQRCDPKNSTWRLQTLGHRHTKRPYAASVISNHISASPEVTKDRRARRWPARAWWDSCVSVSLGTTRAIKWLVSHDWAFWVQWIPHYHCSKLLSQLPLVACGMSRHRIKTLFWIISNNMWNRTVICSHA